MSYYFKFEDFNDSGPDKVDIGFSGKEYRVVERPGTKDVFVIGDDGAETCHPIGHYSGAYAKCYVMNINGVTIDRIISK